ncbi:MAG TPA: acireductone synthase [Acidiferrobacteraceae bacterium]|nr:acireductone synthase [Acidiferrobacteraceae bacterium]
MIAGIVTDIEGTTSSLSFVRDVLFPYARAALPEFIAAHGTEPPIRALLDEARVTAGLPPDAPLTALVALLQGWIDQDLKIPALKALQGFIWRQGYEEAAFQGHVYEDAAARLHAWHEQGLRLYVFSSGSVAAQRLLFRYSCCGDLEPLFAGFFDTRTGAKRAPDAYRSIAAATGCEAQRLLYLSDVAEELTAARSAGLNTVLVDRGAAATGPCVRDFSEIVL